MPLNLEPRNENFTPYLKFNGKAGRWYTRNDIGEEVEVTDLTAIFDLAQVRTGWIYFAEGEPPKTYWDSNGAIASKPPDMLKAKRGFAVNVFAPKLGGLREFSATSNGAVVAMRDLYDNQFENAPERLQGKVPVVKCERVLPMKSKFGTNYEPVLKIINWVDRPVGLQLAETAASAIIPPPPKSADFEVAAQDDLDDEIRLDVAGPVVIETDRTRLIRLLRMFSSDYDGEVASAAPRAHELIQGRQLDWDELIVKIGSARSSGERRSSSRASGPIADIRRCQKLGEHLTEWEADFIESIAGSILEWGRLTPGQQAVLDRITNKLKLAGLWEGEAW